MVRINLIKPKYLTDQHLIAEYNEILMLLGYVRKYPETSLDDIPKNYKLGEGHILFFKNKLKYLKNRFIKIKKEMKKRGFECQKKISISEFDKKLKKSWKPKKTDKEIIKKRLIKKIKAKPGYYRYYKEIKPRDFLIDLIKNGK